MKSMNYRGFLDRENIVSIDNMAIITIIAILSVVDDYNISLAAHPYTGR